MDLYTGLLKFISCMTTKAINLSNFEIADNANLTLSLACGILVSLFGFHILGKEKNFDNFYFKWGNTCAVTLQTPTKEIY